MSQLSLFPEFRPELHDTYSETDRLCAICRQPLVGMHKGYRNMCQIHAKQQMQFTYYFRRSHRLEIATALQNNRCLICGVETQLVVDHDHKTMAFRGLLSRPHNSAISWFSENPQYLKNAAEYLEVFTQDVWRLVAFHNGKTQSMFDSENRLARATAMLERLHND